MSHEKEIDNLANQIDEHLCLKTLEELKTFAIEIGITTELADKSKRQIRGYITKYYEGIIEDADKNNDEKTKLLLGIIERITAKESTDQK